MSRLAVMVDDLLALGRTHALALHIQRAPADVRALVDGGRRRGAGARSGARASCCTRRPSRCRRMMDAQRLRQALDNLLDNAIRHARSEVRVELACEAACELVLAVEDDGPGIDRELLPRLFDAFAQGSGQRRAARASDSRRCAPSPRRTAAASASASRGERGARFTLRLPLAAAGTVAP